MAQTMAGSSELSHLIRAQLNEMRAEAKGRFAHGKDIAETDLADDDDGFSLNGFSASDPPIDLDNPWHFHFRDGAAWDWYGCMGFFEPEPTRVHKETPGRQRYPCPVCGGRPGRGHHYCSRCDTTGLDEFRQFPGIKENTALDPTWAAEATVYVAPEDGLAGGKGAPPLKGRRQRRASRRRAVA